MLGILLGHSMVKLIDENSLWLQVEIVTRLIFLSVNYISCGIQKMSFEKLNCCSPITAQKDGNLGVL